MKPGDVEALLDENMPHSLGHALEPEVSSRTVQEMGWSGISNGQLLNLAAKHFDLFVTTDQGIPHEQNLERYPIAVVVLVARTNRMADLVELVPVLKNRLGQMGPGSFERIRD